MPVAALIAYHDAWDPLERYTWSSAHGDAMRFVAIGNVLYREDNIDKFWIVAIDTRRDSQQESKINFRW